MSKIIKLNEGLAAQGIQKRLICPSCHGSCISAVIVKYRKQHHLVKIICTNEKCKRKGRPIYDVIYGVVTVR